MGLSRYEQETIINFNDEEDFVTIYTSSPVQNRRIANFRQVVLETKDTQDGVPIAYHYRIPKNIFRYGIRRESKMTDEQKEKLKERFAKGRLKNARN